MGETSTDVPLVWDGAPRVSSAEMASGGVRQES